MRYPDCSTRNCLAQPVTHLLIERQRTLQIDQRACVIPSALLDQPQVLQHRP